MTEKAKDLLTRKKLCYVDVGGMVAEESVQTCHHRGAFWQRVVFLVAGQS